MSEVSGQTPYPSTLGVILAGGLSRRMGGGDKGLKMLGGQSLLAHVKQRLCPQVGTLILNANGDSKRFSALDLPVIADSLPNYPGPLAGILAALDYAAAHHPSIEWVVSVAGDGPFLPSDLVSRLHEARRQAGLALACAASDSFTHPTIALWQVRLRDDLRRAMVEEELRKIDAWTARHGFVAVEWESTPFDPFFNANTLDELAQAQAMMSLHRV